MTATSTPEGRLHTFFKPPWRELGQGTLTRVVTDGTRVRRPLNHWSPAVHQALMRFEAFGCVLAPRYLGSEDGHELLDLLPGTAVRRPWPAAMTDDSLLYDLGRMLRVLHQASRNLRLVDDARFAWGPAECPAGAVVVHGDLGPWNLLLDNARITGIIDWDLAYFGDPLEDLVEAAFEFVPLRKNRDMLPADVSVMQLRRRLEALCEGYGDLHWSDVLDTVDTRVRSRIATLRALGHAGRAPFDRLLDEGIAEALAEDLDVFAVLEPQLRVLPSASKRRSPETGTHGRDGLASEINLTDAQARLPLSAAQRQLVDALPRLFEQARTQKQADLEQGFLTSFFALAGQSSWTVGTDPLLSYSASSAIRIAGAVLRDRHGDIALIEPCFPSIVRLLTAEGHRLRPLDEDHPFDRVNLERSFGRGLAALWIVWPNNPSGRVRSPGELVSLASWCRDTGTVLVCDFCFRFFSRGMEDWDQYRILQDSGASFVLFEDTGKTWPTLAMKVGVTVCSPDLWYRLHRAHDDLLLNVSPLHLLLNREFIDLSRAEGLDLALRDLIAARRAEVARLYTWPFLSRASKHLDQVPFEWIRTPSPDTTDRIVEYCAEHGVQLLPGGNFHWHSGRGGDRFRISLGRPLDELRLGCNAIHRACTKVSDYRRA